MPTMVILEELPTIGTLPSSKPLCVPVTVFNESCKVLAVSVLAPQRLGYRIAQQALYKTH
jgi:hypothetical protein